MAASRPRLRKQKSALARRRSGSGAGVQPDRNPLRTEGLTEFSVAAGDGSAAMPAVPRVVERVAEDAVPVTLEATRGAS